MVQSKVKVKSQSHVTTDGQSVSMSWCLVHSALFQVKVTLQLRVSQSLCQGIEHILGLVTRYYLLRLRVTLQLTVCQSVRLGVEPTLGLNDQILSVFVSLYTYSPCSR
jgi:hypothetical protein